MRHLPTYSCEVMIIGAGMAGMAATVFAVNRGLLVVQAGGLGGWISPPACWMCWGRAP